MGSRVSGLLGNTSLKLKELRTKTASHTVERWACEEGTHWLLRGSPARRNWKPSVKFQGRLISAQCKDKRLSDVKTDCHPHTLRSLLLKYLISSSLQCRGVRLCGDQLDLAQLYPRLIEGQLSAEASQLKRRQATLSGSSPTVCLGGSLGADGIDGCLVLTEPFKGHFRQVCQSSDGESSQAE